MRTTNAAADRFAAPRTAPASRMKHKKAFLLINLGSPDSPRPRDVYRYLTQFLNDPRVIDINPVARALLVNLFIVPFRFLKSAALYKKLWTENGSPLVYYAARVCGLLEKAIDDESTRVFVAMRYGSPSLQGVMRQIKNWQPDELIVLPLFPQYASASTGSALAEVYRLLRQWHVVPQAKVIAQFYDHPKWIECWQLRAQSYQPASYDHVLFSFHGLPQRQLDKCHKNSSCNHHACETEINLENGFCYKATCYATARLIAGCIGLQTGTYTVCFQSRLGRGWVKPFTDEVIVQLAQQSKKKLLVFSPSFVADCLETTIEISQEYQALFRAHGGETLQLVESLNDSTQWVVALREIAFGN